MIRCVVALACEARPLISHYRLARSQTPGPFPLYLGDRMLLVVSGPGRISAAAAVAYIQGLSTVEPTASAPQLCSAWLNFGIAGHQSLALGTPFMAHKIIDPASQQTYYPAFPFKPLSTTSSLTTVDLPETAYPALSGYDMEASGFWPTANRFCSSEMVHCVKIVSDNPDHPTTTLNKHIVEELCAASVDLIDALVDTLSALDSQYTLQTQDPPFLPECKKKWRFSVTQTHQLRHLLSRWQALRLAEPPWPPAPERLPSGRHLLRYLENQIEQQPFPL
jgi:adenosylhomocysteine nucleosidase